MTTGATIVYAIFGASGVAAAVAWVDGELSLDKLLSGGAAGLVVIMFIVVLRFLANDSAKRQEERGAERASVEKITNDFSRTQVETAKQFAETTRFVLEDSRQREVKLHELLRDLNENRA